MSGATILLVDDDPLFRAMGTDLLKLRKWNVRAVDSAESAIESMRNDQPQLLITDIHMPGQDGLALTAHSVANYPEIPVIVLTGQGNEKTAVESFRLGAADYVRKENVRDELVRCVEKLLHEERQVEASIKHPAIKEPPKQMISEDLSKGKSRRDGLEGEYIVRRWGDTGPSSAVANSNEREFCEQRLRILRRQVERLDKWASLNSSVLDKRDNVRQAFADVAHMIPLNNAGQIEIEKRFVVFCRNLSKSGCSILRNGLLREKEWAIFFPHQGQLDSRPICVRASVVRDSPIPLGMYEIGFVFGEAVELRAEDVVVMQSKKQPAGKAARTA